MSKSNTCHTLSKSLIKNLKTFTIHFEFGKSKNFTTVRFSICKYFKLPFELEFEFQFHFFATYLYFKEVVAHKKGPKSVNFIAKLQV